MGPPSQAQRIQLVRASTNSLELSWSSIPNAQYYLLEIQKLPIQPPTEKIKEEIKEPVVPQQKIIYQPSTASAGDKKPMIVLQQAKKSFQLSSATTLPAVRSPSVIKVNQPIKVVNKLTTSVAGTTIQVQRPTFAGNVIKLMPGTIFSGNKIIMKPATTQSSQQIIVGSNVVRPTFTNAQTAIRPPQQIKFMTTAGGVLQQSKPITIGGKTVTLQIAGQKKVTLVGNQTAVRTGTPQKIIMMPSGSIVTSTASTVTKAPQQPPPKIEQLDGAIDDEAMDEDIENQINTVKIEKQTADEVKVTNEKIEDNEAAAILSTISEQNLLSAHSVNTVIPLHDEKALRNSLNQNLLASPIIGNTSNDFNGDSSLDALAAAALEASSKNSVNLATTLNEANGGVCKLEKSDENEKWMLVGVFKTLTQNVSHYVDYQWEDQPEKLTSEVLPDLSLLEKIPLEQGRAYRFRIAGVNACGVGKFSEVRTLIVFDYNT